MSNIPAEKPCHICGVTKPLHDFYRAAGMRDGHRNDCKVCNNAAKHARYMADPEPAKQRTRQWQRENAERLNAYRRERRKLDEVKRRERASHLKRKFGITLEQYEEMFKSQGGVCAICGRPPSEKYSLHVDHDHFTGKIRGLVCFPCNEGLGLFQDDPYLLEAAIAYLERYEREDAEQRIRERLRLLQAN